MRGNVEDVSKQFLHFVCEEKNRVTGLLGPSDTGSLAAEDP